jgi:hypothetical protein
VDLYGDCVKYKFRREEFMKKIVVLMLIGTIMLFGVSSVAAAPWVYPADEPSPTTTEYWTVLVTEGPHDIDLVVWNHANNKDFVNGMFVIAIKSGDVTITAVEVAGDPTSAADAGTGTPGHPFPPGSIFPCDWEQYPLPDLQEWDSELGWQGAVDASGVPVTVSVTVEEGSGPVLLYFLAFGYDVQPNGSLQPSDTPYSHITFTVPELPLGTILATGSMLAALGAFYVLRKRKIP